MRENDVNARNTVGTRLDRVRNSLTVAPGGSIPDAIQSSPYRVSRISCIGAILSSFLFGNSWSQWNYDAVGEFVQTSEAQLWARNHGHGIMNGFPTMLRFFALSTHFDGK
jgi:hypothetical protein